jgi:signal peptidase I
MTRAADLGGAGNAAGDGAPPPARRRTRPPGWAAVLLLALSLALVTRAFVFQAFSIPSSSMEPALHVHDRIGVWKALFDWHGIRQGEIVVFRHPPLDHCGGPAGTDLVKRVIALPGQTIYSAGNTVYVNGRRLPEPYLPAHQPLGPPIPGASRQAPFRVPPGEFYMMGDNRPVSCDSRFWGPVKGTSIIGRAVFVFWRDGHPSFHVF